MDLFKLHLDSYKDDETLMWILFIVNVLNHLGIQHPNVAVLALVEKPSFHMRDTVGAQNIVRAHLAEPIADCELVGPIPWDLIVSKEAMNSIITKPKTLPIHLGKADRFLNIVCFYILCCNCA